jgi:hypothetical protein
VLLLRLALLHTGRALFPDGARLDGARGGRGGDSVLATASSPLDAARSA